MGSHFFRVATFYPGEGSVFLYSIRKEARFFWSLPAMPPQDVNPLFSERLSRFERVQAACGYIGVWVRGEYFSVTKKRQRQGVGVFGASHK